MQMSGNSTAIGARAMEYLLRLDVKNSLMTVGAFASGLLRQVAHGSALVEQAQLAGLALGILRVAVDSAIQHGPVKVTDQAADVARGVGLPRGARVLQAVDVLLQVVVPKCVVAFVHGVDLARLGDLNLVMREHELAVQRVQSEAVDAIAHGQDQDHGAGVHAVAGRQQVAAGLAHVHDAILCDLVYLHHQSKI